MKVCVVGSGGREHALAHVLARTAEVIVTPGNPGIPFSTNQPVKEIEAEKKIRSKNSRLVTISIISFALLMLIFTKVQQYSSISQAKVDIKNPLPSNGTYQ